MRYLVTYVLYRILNEVCKQIMESTIPNGRMAGRTKKLGIEPATAQFELGLGLSLVIETIATN